MLKKTCRTQFFDKSEYSNKSLIINILQTNLPLLLPNAARTPPTFKFLFRYISKTDNYTLLNILTELRCLLLRSPVLFQKLYAENFSKLLSF